MPTMSAGNPSNYAVFMHPADRGLEVRGDGTNSAESARLQEFGIPPAETVKFSGLELTIRRCVLIVDDADQTRIDTLHVCLNDGKTAMSVYWMVTQALDANTVATLLSSHYQKAHGTLPNDDIHILEAHIARYLTPQAPALFSN
jgi:hypothetical protein